MKRLAIFASCIGLLFISNTLQAQDNTVSLEIIDTDSTIKVIELEWPYDGPPPVGSNISVMDIIYNKLSENNIDCPPERKKISENIWKCGNGKKIRTKDKRLARILSSEWDD